MGLFKRRSYSRDDYDNAKKDVVNKEQLFISSPGHVEITSLADIGEIGARNRDIVRNYMTAKSRLTKIEERQYGEAVKLNKEYDALVSKLGKDSEKVYEFERDKLGMHKHERVKKNIGTATGVISIILLISASILSANITGNVIGANGLFQANSILLMGGLVFGVVWLLARR